MNRAPVANAQTDVATRIDTYVRSRMPALRTPGLAVVVVVGDDVILSRGYGVADRDSATPMMDDTPVAVASTTKGFTALAMMRLVEQGLVELDAPVAEYVPELEKALDPDAATNISLDMSNVTFVDRKAMEFLCGVKSRVMIENIPSYVLRWIEQEFRCGSSQKEHSEF